MAPCAVRHLFARAVRGNLPTVVISMVLSLVVGVMFRQRRKARQRSEFERTAPDEGQVNSGTDGNEVEVTTGASALG